MHETVCLLQLLTSRVIGLKTYERCVLVQQRTPLSVLRVIVSAASPMTTTRDGRGSVKHFTSRRASTPQTRSSSSTCFVLPRRRRSHPQVFRRRSYTATVNLRGLFVFIGLKYSREHQSVNRCCFSRRATSRFNSRFR